MTIAGAGRVGLGSDRNPAPQHIALALRPEAPVSEDLDGYHARQRANAAENRLRAVDGPGPRGDAAPRPGMPWPLRLLIGALLIGLGWMLRGWVGWP